MFGPIPVRLIPTVVYCYYFLFISLATTSSYSWFSMGLSARSYSVTLVRINKINELTELKAYLEYFQGRKRGEKVDSSLSSPKRHGYQHIEQPQEKKMFIFFPRKEVLIQITYIYLVIYKNFGFILIQALTFVSCILYFNF